MVALAIGHGSSAVADDCFFDGDCADGNVCNGIERCDGGTCVASDPIPCDDGDPCTADSCDPAIGCAHAEELCPADCTGLGDGERCIDGTVCTVGDTCQGGTCVPGPAPSCPDIDECTSATCDAVFGCVYIEQFVSPPCVAECTGTVADFTRCPGDANICTIDACLPSTSFGDDKCIDGLLFGRQCADGDLCNGDEWCSPVLGCQANAPRVCDDGDICNGTESCDPQAGCQAGTPLPDATPCDDHLQCTAGDQCHSEVCGGTPLTAVDCDDSDPSTTDECREGFGCLGCRALDARGVTVKFTQAGKQNGKITLRGTIALGSATVVPDADGFTLIVDLGGGEVYRATLAGGAIVARAPGKFAFDDKTGAIANGLRKIRLKERNAEIGFKSASTRLGISGPQAGAGEAVLVIGDDCFSSVVACTATGGGKGLKCGG
jgi:Dictyostelium (slime mold) repeat